MQKKILITGGAGYIGSHASLYLKQKGFVPVIIDNFVHNQYFPSDIGVLYKGDIGDRDLLNSIFLNHQIECVMHFAANIEVGESILNPAKYYDNNVAKTLVLLDAMIARSVKKIVFSSSAAVYGVPDESPITEKCKLNPISPYGKTKFFIESILQDYDRAYGLKSVSLRYFNAAGAMPEFGLGEQHMPETHLIPLLFKSMKTGLPFKLFGNDYLTKDGTCVRDFLHVWDIAQAHCLAFDYLVNFGYSEMFNLGSEKGFSVKEIIEHIENIYNKKINIVLEKRREGDPAILLADSSRIKNVLRWSAYCSNLDFILETAYDFEYNFKKSLPREKFSGIEN